MSDGVRCRRRNNRTRPERFGRTLQQIPHRRDGQLHRGHVDNGIADPALAAIARASQFRQAVVPGVVEAIVGGEIDNDRVCVGGIERGDAGGGPAVWRGEHQRRGTTSDGSASLRRRRIAQLARIRINVIGKPLAVESRKADIGQLEARMRGQQTDQFDAGAWPRAPTIRHGKYRRSCVVLLKLDLESAAQRRPFAQDGEHVGIAQRPVAMAHVRTQDAIALCAQAQNGRLRAKILMTRFQHDHLATPLCERMPDQQQFSLGVQSGALHALRIPRVAELDPRHAAIDVE